MIKGMLFGIAVGDALGVPVEFCSREEMRMYPVTEMTSGGVHRQLPGTFSDDSSLSFCQAEAILGSYSLDKLAALFIDWRVNGYWSARGEVFDKGNATEAAIRRLRNGTNPLESGARSESENGNGSLMRILPLLWYVKDMPAADRYRYVLESSSVTHAHIRSVICCYYYIEYARQLLQGKDTSDAYRLTNQEVRRFLATLAVEAPEIARLGKLWSGKIHEMPEESISGSGYVLHSLEASIWCLLSTASYEEAVLKAIHLGEDTDSTAAITGGLAGMLYGYEGIPERWLEPLARKEDIADLAARMEAVY